MEARRRVALRVGRKARYQVYLLAYDSEKGKEEMSEIDFWQGYFVGVVVCALVRLVMDKVLP
jgi:hypothetical protein